MTGARHEQQASGKGSDMIREEVSRLLLFKSRTPGCPHCPSPAWRSPATSSGRWYITAYMMKRRTGGDSPRPGKGLRLFQARGGAGAEHEVRAGNCVSFRRIPGVCQHMDRILTDLTGSGLNRLRKEMMTRLSEKLS
jgi:hypothetical protein